MLRIRFFLVACSLAFLSAAQNGKQDLAVFGQQYIPDSIAAVGQRYLDRHPQPTRDRNRVVCRMIGNEAQQGHFQKAYALYERALKETADPVQQAFLFREYGLLSSLDGYQGRAQEYYIRALKAMEKHRQYEGEVILLTDLAELSRKTVVHKVGVDYLQKALKIAAEHGIDDPRLLAQIYNRFAAIRNELSEHDECIRLSQTALRYAEEVNDYHLQAVSWNELGYCYGKAGTAEQSMDAYRKADALWMKAHRYQDATLAKFNIIQGLMHKGLIPREECVRRFRELLQFIEAHGVTFEMDRIYGHLVYLNARLGNYKEAFEYGELRQKAEAVNDTRVNQRNLDQLREQYQNELLKKETRTAKQRLESSRHLVERKQRENTMVIIAATVLALLLVVIALLYYRTRKDKRSLEREGRIKDSLIREIHHRVKNNLQFVSSLMNMQVNASNNDSEIYALNDASRRIRSMALVHEMLYNHDDAQTVSLKIYIEELIETLKDLSSAQEQSVKFVTSVTDMQISVAQSVALGMISSELVSNALKHAFAGVGHPSIELTVDLDPQGICHFALRDNGPGFPQQDSHRQNLGMRLIDIFSRQLKGTYAFSNDNGLVFRLEFIP